MALEDGIYRVNTWLADADEAGHGWDIENGSTSDNACVWLIHDNDTLAQIFQVSTVTVGSTSYRQFANLKSGKVLEAYSGNAVSGGSVTQFRRWDPTAYADNAAGQMWTVSDTGDTETVNGTEYPLYKISSRKDASVVMDCYGGSSADMTKVWLYRDWGSADGYAAQRWVFHRDSELSSALPVPCSVGRSSADGDAPTTGAMSVQSASATLNPSFVCASGGFQLRYRRRFRKSGTDSWTAWGSWTSPSGSTAEFGWGDPWSASFSSSQPNGNQRCPTAISCGYDLTAYDSSEMQVCVRRFDATGHAYGAAHGGCATETTSVVWRPTVTLGAVGYGPDGLTIGYSTDWTRGGNSIASLSASVGGSTLFDGLSFDGLPASGHVTVPPSSLASTPADGASISLSFSFSTLDGTFYGYALSGTVAYDADGGISLSPTYREIDGKLLQVTLPAYAGCSVWMERTRDGRTDLVDAEHPTSTTWVLAPPLNESPHIFISAYKSDGTWGVRDDRPDAISCSDCVWNWDGGHAFLRYGSGSAPSESHSLERDSTTVQPNGSDFGVTIFNHVSKRSISVSGTAVHGDTGADVPDFEALSTCDYATFRTPYGFTSPVAVKKVSFDHGVSSDDVSIDMEEQS